MAAQAAAVLRSPQELTGPWLSAVLGSGAIEHIEVERIGTGQMSESRRVQIVYASGEDVRTHPASVVVKTASEDETSRSTGVGLGGGLQTSCYRLNRAGVGDQFKWFTVDLPAVVELRRKLLPPSERIRMSAQSALDFSWMDQVDAADGVQTDRYGVLDGKLHLPHREPRLAVSAAQRVHPPIPSFQAKEDPLGNQAASAKDGILVSQAALEGDLVLPASAPLEAQPAGGRRRGGAAG